MRLLALLLSACGLFGQISPQTFAAQDLEDLPFVSRFSGSVLLDGATASYAEVEFPSAQGAKDKFVPGGKLTWRMYLAPEGRSPIEVYRNYEAALKAGGFQVPLTCTPQGCAWRGYSKPEAYPNRITELAPGKRILISYANSPALPTDLISANNTAGLYAKRTQNGATQHVLLAIASKVPASSLTLADRKTMLKDLGEQTYFFLAILEEKAPETGNVQVFDAKAIQSKLTGEGKAVFYSLYFDTGKADLKAESKPQLDTMAEMLKANPAFLVYIVGHTDTVGDFTMNLDLSRRRAQAVAAALSGNYAIPAARISAQGAGPLSPVASNAEEAGRQLNRRVEMVLR
jgi:OmpA-OmpF porin, OOP family